MLNKMRNKNVKEKDDTGTASIDGFKQESVEKLQELEDASSMQIGR